VGPHQVVLHQQTNYPWDGMVHFEIELDEPAEFRLYLRIPGWCPNARLTLADQDIPFEMRKGYAHVTRTWQTGDVLVLSMEMPVERIYPHPAIRENVGKIALRSGPLLYCLESCDNPLPLHQICVPADAVFEKHFIPDLLGGIMMLNSDVEALETSDWADTLYRTTPPVATPYKLTALPYHAWDQREPGEMRLWLRAD
ncbi:MAG: glycoside hydrolase family 127 protein, partial [Ktedonobacteraceae bacterium]|nr:glycoside hydrolase family 127 protein [Ktedonobacteraceae bacterium]